MGNKLDEAHAGDTREGRGVDSHGFEGRDNQGREAPPKSRRAHELACEREAGTWCSVCRADGYSWYGAGCQQDP